ncbi:hypothetical protein [Deinococcus peraridilitoris]|uniref:Uncharacterized protein n=1 Tax=Deinococcus peraridilitoris (strain DSM 19664 / LMG 22246 / CIP 109416 / KR-200) TaxID=937777 RepID=L0A958_DEIPD|nr:hypothetical protein [Deinococcus peraridilitoris]AFZ69657.1 hypothetical protein Deipe_4316 [Deinococcus peraridilitoris DSM 19664]
MMQVIFTIVALEKLTHWIGSGKANLESAFGVGLVATLCGVLLPLPLAVLLLVIATGLMLTLSWL